MLVRGYGVKWKLATALRAVSFSSSRDGQSNSLILNLPLTLDELLSVEVYIAHEAERLRRLRSQKQSSNAHQTRFRESSCAKKIGREGTQNNPNQAED